MHYAVVIPALNESATVADVAERALGFTSRVIVVDDGSVDGTAERVGHLPVVLIRNEVTIGKAASLAHGFAAAMAQSLDAVITLDGDGQHAPEDIPRLVDAAARYPGDIIIAARLEGRESMPLSRRIGNAQADFWISWAAGYPVRDTQCGFRLYPAAVIEHLPVRQGRRNGFVFESESLIEAARAGSYARTVGIRAVYGRSPRASHYRASADTLRIVFMVAGKLLRSGLYPLGLLRSLGLLSHPVTEHRQATEKSSDALG